MQYVLDPPTAIEEKLQNKRIFLLFPDSMMCITMHFANSGWCVDFVQSKNIFSLDGCKAMLCIRLLRSN